MLGSFHDAEEVVQDVLMNAWKARESYTGAAPFRHWLLRIATNACLNAQRASRVRLVPRRGAPTAGDAPIGVPVDPDGWITAAPDHALFGSEPERDAGKVLEERERVALAFIGLLQQLPPRQRAVLLLKDVVDFSVEEIGDALEMSTAAVSSALHRAREAMPARADECCERAPSPEALREYIRCWEMRDLDGLLALLRSDVVLSMPPWPIWYEGRASVKAFITTKGFTTFWSSGLRLVPTSANGRAAVLFYRDKGEVLHSVQVLGFDGTSFTEMCNLIGSPFLYGFESS